MSSLSYSIHNVAGRRISYMDCKSLQNVLEDWFKFSGYDKDQKEFNLLSYEPTSSGAAVAAQEPSVSSDSE